MSSSPITTEVVAFPSTLGEMLREDFLEPLQMSAAELAAKLMVTEPVLEAVLNDERPVDPDLDLRLGRYFGLSAGFFLGYQSSRDLRIEGHRLGATLDQIAPRMARAA